MARPVNAHRRAIIEAQQILKESARRADAAGHTLSALLDKAKVPPTRWRAWMEGRALPQARSLEAVKLAAAELAE